jgi:hypothetical protein
MVGVVDSAHPGPDDVTVKRWNKNKRVREDISSHRSIQNYNFKMGCVDAFDAALKAWGVSVRTGSWQNRVAFQFIDVRLNNLYKAFTFTPSALNAAHIGRGGRMRFQMALAHRMVNLGIRRDCPTANADRPRWMRQRQHPLYPCDCGVCFFCEVGLTNGVLHRPSGHVARPGRKPLPCKMIKLGKRKGTCWGCYSRLAGYKRDHPDECTGDKWTSGGMQRRRGKGTWKCRTCNGVWCGTCKDLH